MVHTGNQVFGRFTPRINQWKAPPPGGAITEHFNRTLPGADFICGYVVELVGPHPVDFAKRLAGSRGFWGTRLRETMLDYNHWAGVGMVGEVVVTETSAEDPGPPPAEADPPPAEREDTTEEVAEALTTPDLPATGGGALGAGLAAVMLALLGLRLSRR